MKQFRVLAMIVVHVVLSAHATTRYVSPTGGNVPPYTSLANAARLLTTAIGVCEPGDEVLVAPGTYHHPTEVLIAISNLSVRSTGGAASTIIDGSNDHCCVLVNGAYGSELQGFTLRNGRGRLSPPKGGALYMTGAGTVRDCIIRDSCATNGGGVIMSTGTTLSNCVVLGCTGSDGGGVWAAHTARILGCTIVSNRGHVGGGIYVWYGTEVRECVIGHCFATNGGGVFLENGGSLLDSTIEANTGWFGGGVCLWPAGLVSNCVVRNNTALGGGGGAACREGGVLQACVISNNSSEYVWLPLSGLGGGVLTYLGGTLLDSTVHANRAAGDGGGVYLGIGEAVRCTISGNHADDNGGGVVLNGGALTDCTVMHNVAADDGGGVHSFSSGHVRDTLVQGNTALAGGGGVRISFGGSFSNCVISGNRAQNGGGALSGLQSGYTGLFEHCVITGNLAQAAASEGGGLYMGGSGSNIVRDSLIAYNTAFGTNVAKGGGVANPMYSQIPYLYLTRCTIVGNVATGYSANGGGVQLSKALVDRCTITGNRACGSAANGGGFYCAEPDVEATSCLVTHNTAHGIGQAQGGGVYNYKSARIMNCTVCDNTASGNPSFSSGGGMYAATSAAIPLNCIIYYNEAHSAANLQGTYGSLFSCITPLPVGSGNIDEAPEFLARGSGDYRLLASSPCIDAGTNQPWMTSALDLGGDPRVWDGLVDMGCYEYIPEPAGVVLLLAGVAMCARRRARA